MLYELLYVDHAGAVAGPVTVHVAKLASCRHMRAGRGQHAAKPGCKCDKPDSHESKIAA